MSLRTFFRTGAWYQDTQKALESDLEATAIVSNADPYDPVIVGGGSGSTPTLDEVLAEGGAFTEDRDVDLDQNSLTFSNGDVVFGQNIILKEDGGQTERFIRVEDQTNDGNGGNPLTIQGGSGLNNDGGDIAILAGNAIAPIVGGRGGSIQIKGGIGREATQAGGSILIRGGEGQADPGVGASNGGDVNIEGGFSEELGTIGGNVNISAGSGATIGSATYSALTHTFTGKVISPTLLADDFADDAAAATGGITVGGLYHNSGAVRVRIS